MLPVNKGIPFCSLASNLQLALFNKRGTIKEVEQEK